MTRVMLLLSLVSLITITAGCGGGSSSVGSGSSLVTITVGGDGKSASVSIGKNTFVARSVFHARKFMASAGSAFAAIPAGVTEIEFNITGPEADFQPQTRRVPVIAGQADITEQFVVPNGNRRHFLVEANDASGNPLYSGENYVDLAGVPVSVAIDMNALTQPSLNLAFSITPSEVVIETRTVMVTIVGTVANNGNETLNGVTCSDSFGTELSGVPASIQAGGSATISGAYYPDPPYASFSNTLTCSGTGAQSGVYVSQAMPASSYFTPAISFTSDIETTLGCYYFGETNFYLYGNFFNSGNETVVNVDCNASFGLIQSIEWFIPLNIRSFYSENESGHPATETITCTGNGFFSNIAFSNSTTLTCH